MIPQVLILIIKVIGGNLFQGFLCVYANLPGDLFSVL